MPHACLQKLRKKINMTRIARKRHKIVNLLQKMIKKLLNNRESLLLKFKIMTKILVTQKGLIHCINVMAILQMLKQKDG